MDATEFVKSGLTALEAYAIEQPALTPVDTTVEARKLSLAWQRITHISSLMRPL
jgi:hypothetical protein